TGSVDVLQGVEFEVEPHENHTSEVEPHGNYRKDGNETVITVVVVEMIYAHESLDFNDTVTCVVTSKWKAVLKEEIDARSEYMLSNDGMVFLADANMRSRLPRVCWIKQREMYLVRRSSRIRVGFLDFDYAMGRLITVMGRSRTWYGLMIHGCARSCEAKLQHMEALSTTKAKDMTLTRAVKEFIWLKGPSTESGAILRLVAINATRAYKGGPGSRFQHGFKAAAYRRRLI
ncbi:hypothetical protein Tco_1373569, partial [Tanacetum coccineum]